MSTNTMSPSATALSTGRRGGRRWLSIAPIVAVLIAVTVPSGGVVRGSDATVAGSCLDTPSVPCSASAGQTYGALTLGADGNDDESSVEAVLSQVVGPGADVAALARGVTSDSGDLDFTPDTVTGGQRFDWSYHGPAQNVAYLTIKAGTGFAVVGIAGTTSGSVDVTTLLGGHDISHVSLWATTTSQTEPVVAKVLHGKDFLGNSRLAKIDNGTVPCLHVETAAAARCVFTRTSGSWLDSGKGRFAKVGQAITLDGKPGGEYVVAAKINPDGTVPALDPAGHDDEGVPAGTELAAACVVETMSSPYNVTGQRLVNYATREVGTSSYPHPDGAQLTREEWNGAVWIYYYIGQGAGLNDVNGTERDQNGIYLPESVHCHIIWQNGYEVFGAKRPSTKSYPAPGVVWTTTALIWRPVNEAVQIAN
jgi:hypothetical protein